MSYKEGMLRITTHKGYDSKDDRDTEKGEVILPHSCDSWVIGDYSNIMDLIDDLQAVLDGEYPHKGEYWD